MDYFRKYLGTPQGGATPTGAETVERLVDRVQSSTLLEDRRDAVRALKSLSKKFRLEVGTQGLDVLINVLQVDRNDSEILGYALETLCNVVSNEPPDDEDDINPDVPEDIGSQFTEMFIKNTDNVGLLLSLLEEYDFHVRWPTVKLVTLLLSNKSRDLQEAILVSPMGVSKLMDLLADSREIIRNDGLLLLIQLTKGNANIQKIVAFENAFERLLDIVREEGNSDGGIVVEDCLLLLLNLLKNNSSNQIFFKEGGFIQRLPPFFQLDSADNNPQGGWSAQKVTNIHLMLQMIRTLVSPNNPAQQTASAQKLMNQCGLLQQLCTILMASGVPADVLTETINAVSEVIRGNEGNQEYFASVMAPSNPPRPAIVVLLMSMVNDKQPFVLRCAVLYCFQSFLYKNELGQSQIVQTLLPSTTDGKNSDDVDVNTISAGHLLCGGLFSTDSLSTWFAAVALLHSIVDNAGQKEQLLRVQLATSLGNPPVSLLQQCTNILAQGGAKFQTRVGLLMLLCHWLASCPIAVTHFLHNPNNVPFLISQVCASEGDEQELLVQGMCSFLLGVALLYNTDQVETCTRQHLRGVMEKRIGLELFQDKLSQIHKHESYARTIKKPQLEYKHYTEVIFDFEFTRLFKKLESEVLRCVSPVEDEEESTGNKSRADLDQHESIVKQYKELIREQDAQLTSLKEELATSNLRCSESRKKLEDLGHTVQQLKDQNALLKAQRAGSAGPTNDAGNDVSRLHQDIDVKNGELDTKDLQITQLKSELAMAEVKLARLSGEDNHLEAGESSVLQARVNVLTTEQEDMKKKVQQKEEEVRLYKGKYEDANKQIVDLRDKLSVGNATDSASAAVLEERNALSSRVQLLEQNLKTAEEERNRLKEEAQELQLQVKRLSEEKSEAEDDKLKALEEAQTMRQEQDDLLVLLADQDTKLNEFKGRLKSLGEKVEEDEDDDDGDDDEEEGDEEED